MSISTKPNALWRRLASTGIMGITSVLSKGFMFYLNDTRAVGLDSFLDYLEKRRGDGRSRGLITVSNHISVLDDPLIWSVLPLRMAAEPSNMRWSLGAHDICFQSKLASAFFSLGQVLPTHRLQHSAAGGPFQPTMTQAIRLLSGPQDNIGALTSDMPVANVENHLSWLHVFPEGRVIQQPTEDKRTGYFKWGISRLILETEPAPDLVPIFIEGMQHIMPEGRGWPRWAPHIGVPVRITFGAPVSADAEFGDYRRRWSRLTQAECVPITPRGELPDTLKYGEEACALRMEVAGDVRSHVTQLARHVK